MERTSRAARAIRDVHSRRHRRVLTLVRASVPSLESVASGHSHMVSTDTVPSSLWCKLHVTVRDNLREPAAREAGPRVYLFLGCSIQELYPTRVESWTRRLPEMERDRSLAGLSVSGKTITRSRLLPPCVHTNQHGNKHGNKHKQYCSCAGWPTSGRCFTWDGDICPPKSERDEKLKKVLNYYTCFLCRVRCPCMCTSVFTSTQAPERMLE